MKRLIAENHAYIFAVHYNTLDIFPVYTAYTLV